MAKHGFILPFSIIVALVILTSLGLWFHRIILQGHLAERLLQQRANYLECRSLIPVLTEQLNELSLTSLEQEEREFLVVIVDGQECWQVGRSALLNGKIQVQFRRVERSGDSLMLTVPYVRKEVSGFPPDFAAERGRVLETSAFGH